MENKFLYFILIIVIILAVFLVPKIEESKFQKVEIGEKFINLETVDTHQGRVKGLSGRDSLDEDTGLFFVFPDKDFHGIWMKEMNFDIDILWLDENFNVVGMKKSAGPETYPEVFYPEGLARYVLEINSGILENQKIKIGQTLNFF